MDPLTALGLAAAVVQFVSFTFKIITTVASSDPAGAPGELVSLDDVYTKLRVISQKLVQTSRASSKALEDDFTTTASSYPAQLQWNFQPSLEQLLAAEDDDLGRQTYLFPTLRDSYRSLSELSVLCERDCAEITTIVERLRASHHPSSRWSTLRMTVRLLWKKNEIEQLEARLGKIQKAVLTEMCNLSTIYHDLHSKDLAAFRRESESLGVQHTTQLKAIESALQKLVDRGDKGLTASSAATELFTVQRMMAHVRLSERNITKELAIISSLGFESRTVRHGAISPAHRETFQWVFRTKPKPEEQEATVSNAADSREDTPNLLDWLKHGGGAFWVSGKPGSGKSTFMKFIADHPATRSALSHWAHPLPAVVASHYFWGSGTEMQRSLQGLLQTLLYDIFRHCPDLIRVTCPSRWETEDQKPQPPWTLTELRTVLEASSAQSQIACKFCFFVDGLDEFDGEHIDFCETLIAMTDSPNLKLCVSSRPWNVFEDALGQEEARKIYIHELTKADIVRYAQDRLHQHPRWRLLKLHPSRANRLIESIADKARGVFLWVTIVTRLLREGLTNDDTPADLRRRLESFPSDLEPFFKQIVGSVPEFYRVKMAEALRMALSAHEPLDAIIYSFHDDEEQDDCPANFAGEFSPHPLDWEFSINAGAMQDRREQVGRRLNGRCQGLLEVNFLGQIDFLHRTVADFLRTREMSDFLHANTAPNFAPNLAILKAFTAWVKTAGPVDSRFSVTSIPGSTSPLQTELRYNIKKALEYAARAEFDSAVPKSSLDDAIDGLHAVSTLVSSRHLLFRELVLKVPLMGYLSRKLPQDPTYFFDFGEPALSVVLHYPNPPPTQWPVKAAEKITCLLHSGHNPNQHLPGTGLTIWSYFLSETMVESPAGSSYNGITAGPRFLAALETGLFPIFLEHGADPNVSLDPLSSPLERLAVLGFSLPVNVARYEVDYLQVLDAFISRGAKFSPYETDAGATFLLAGPACIHPCVQFFRQLEQAQSHSSPSWVSFCISVLRRVLPLAQQALWPLNAHRMLLEQVIPTLQNRDIEGFPAAVCEVEEALRGKAETHTPGKRRVDDNDQKEKRLRRCIGGRGQPCN
ncbi:hypothetical protein C8A05DRAFT_15235 [Staphylotrichum tortipilum]|uniref:NACHT domain-containing protein n=1 Tax=Staphylotrichum tortipilum TaxID=2831512 RepID=A0AAN6MKU2_9PEZI|nr:hypothetical protein C8A05DRAFT_15235 [Staphylotrichum longicolle]